MVLCSIFYYIKAYLGDKVYNNQVFLTMLAPKLFINNSE